GCRSAFGLRCRWRAVALLSWVRIFFFQAEDGIRDRTVTGVQTCALPISDVDALRALSSAELRALGRLPEPMIRRRGDRGFRVVKIGRASCRERGSKTEAGGSAIANGQQRARPRLFADTRPTRQRLAPPPN